MAQLSRPYQIGLGAIAVLAAVWVLALRGHNSSSSTPSTPQSIATVTTPNTPASKHAAGGSASAPGVAGLNRAVEKAHGAVKTSEQNASQLQQKSEQASSASPQSNPSSTPANSPTTPLTATKPSTHSSSATKTATKTGTTAAKPSHTGKSNSAAPTAPVASGIPAHERAAEAALKRGDVAVILFWDPSGSDDQAVRGAVRSLKGQSKVFTSVARASEVATYGSITRGVQVFGTPTILLVNPKGQTMTLTGLQDGFAIRQAIAEVRHAAS